MTVKALISLRSDDSFKLYWRSRRIESNIKAKTSTKKKSSQQLDDGTAPGDHPPAVEDHYRSIYFQTLDVVISNCIETDSTNVVIDHIRAWNHYCWKQQVRRILQRI